MVGRERRWAHWHQPGSAIQLEGGGMSGEGGEGGGCQHESLYVPFNVISEVTDAIEKGVETAASKLQGRGMDH